MDDEQILEASRRFREILAKLDPFEPAPYRWWALDRPVSGQWMPYIEMLGEFATTLANEINHLGIFIQHLRAWAKVFESCTEDERHELLFELVYPLAFTALHYPAMISSRFSFSITHLCHQAGRGTPGWVDDLEDDGKLGFKTAKRELAAWKEGAKVLDALGKISQKDFEASTLNYRNKVEHRIPPRIEIGLSQFVTRTRVKAEADATPSVQYGFGYSEPLKIEKVADLLQAEHEAARIAFEAFQGLVLEHLAVITAG